MIVWKVWNRFWFEAQPASAMALFRKAIAGLFFGMYAVRTFDLKLFFSESGIMPLKSVPEVLPMAYRTSLLFYWTSDTALWVLHLALLGALALLFFGILPRLTAAVALVLSVSFLHRDMAPTYGVDMIGSFFLFYLMLAGDPWRAKRSSELSRCLSSIGYRLAQCQVCIIYAYSGLDKVKGPQWWSGEALWGVLSNVQLARFDFSIVAHAPLVVVALTYATLMWEIYFPVLVWVKPLRKFMLLFGVALHLGIAAALNLTFFAAIMIFSYILFLDEGVAGRWLAAVRWSEF